MARLGLGAGKGMTFEPENELERVLLRAVNEPAARPEFYRLLLESDLFVLGKIGQKSGNSSTTLLPGDSLQLASIAFKGRNAIPIFTAKSRLESYVRKQRSAYVCLNGRAIFEMTRGSFFILNPGSYGKELLPEEISGMLDPSAALHTVTLDKPTKVLIGQPAVYPNDLVTALKNSFGTRSNVLAAYFAQIAYEEKNEPPHLLIGVEVTQDWDAISTEIARVASIITPGKLLDVVPIVRDGNDVFTASLLKTAPFYTRTDTKH